MNQLETKATDSQRMLKFVTRNSVVAESLMDRVLKVIKSFVEDGREPRDLTVFATFLLFVVAHSNSAIAQRSSLEPIYEGFTQPRFQIMVAATEIGQLESVNVEVGDRVQAGESIAQLENSLQQSAVTIARAQAAMHGELDAAQAELQMNQNRTESVRELAASEMARPDELVRAETDLRVASARAAAAKEQQQLRRLELERYQLQLARREVLAPMSGVISKVFHFPGEYLTPGDPAVAELLVVDELTAVFNIPSEEAVQLQIGRPVVVNLRSSSEEIRARLTNISPEIDGESGTVQVRVLIDNREGKYRAGDRCTLRFVGNEAGSAKRQASRSTPARLGVGVNR